MSKRLVIAEKPSVGKTIAAVLGVREQRKGYLEGQDYIVSWCVGHLGELAGPEGYERRYIKWRREDLPIIPENWKLNINREKYRQFEILKRLMNRSDVDEVINACDAGREGELIFRNLYAMTNCRKPVLRLWISSMEDSAIEEGLRTMKPGSDYDNLYKAARCRECADWLVGINATRLFSVLYHRTLNVGRVVSPTLALLVEREAKINAFAPEPYYTIHLKLPDFEAVSEQYRDRLEALERLEACQGATAKVKDIVNREKTEKAPALYDLTTLQRDANRIHGYSAQQTLDYLQSLYEKKLCTYPRTDSRYLPDHMDDVVRSLTLCAAGIVGMEAPFVAVIDQVCDSAKVTDHHAIIPTMHAGECDITRLPIGEQTILRMIAMQTLKAVTEPHQYTETVVTLLCGGTEFTTKVNDVVTLGWKAYEKTDDHRESIRDFTVGSELISKEVTMNEGVTKPPKRYTEDTLLSAMENAGRKEMPADAERKGIGTPATRASIIEKLVESGFVERKKMKHSTALQPAGVGVSLITILPEQLQSPLMTAEWEHKLKLIENGAYDPLAFIAEIGDMVRTLVDTYEPIPGAEVLFPSGREVVGKCPRCGSEVTESRMGFFCERRDCRFGLWRDNRYLEAKKIVLTKAMVKELLAHGSVSLSGMLYERMPNAFDATLSLFDDGNQIRYVFSYPKEKRV